MDSLYIILKIYGVVQWLAHSDHAGEGISIPKEKQESQVFATIQVDQQLKKHSIQGLLGAWSRGQNWLSLTLK